MSTPLATIRNAVKEILKTEITGVTIYPERSSLESPAVPCIVIQVISGWGKEGGLGQVVEPTKRGYEIFTVLQFDIYHDTKEGRDEITDKVIAALLKNRSFFLSQYKVRLGPLMAGPRELPAAEPLPAHLWRGSIDWVFSFVTERNM